MCGLSGEITFDGTDASISTVQRMSRKLVPRGPDANGHMARGRMALGHRRLKIIDLSEDAEQPMIDSELGLTVVFNGCIYNYKELRQELETRGYRFFSAGDTEVLLKAYHAWGLDCVKHFHGMFAFAIYERDSGRLILGRDRLGIKPLYLAHDKEHHRLRFASTLPALLAAGDVDTSIDTAGLHHYMTFHAAVPAPFTILNGIRKLPPATIAVFERDGKRSNQVYWALTFERDQEDIRAPADFWREQLHNSLRTAVDRRMVADVPVGVLLSGGVDSSLIVGLLAEAGQTKLKTFSIGFEAANGEEGNEFQYSDIVADRFGTDHYKIQVSSKRLLDVVPETVGAMSEPMVSHDSVGFYLLSEEVSQHVKVVQSGQGADEIFAGYHWYPPLMQSNDAVRDYARVFFDRDHSEIAQAISPQFIEDDFSRPFIAGHFAMPGAESAIDRALRLDTTVMLVDDPVKRVDNMTMAWGLEARVPFLDHELVELAARIPPEQKVRDDGKGILKDVAREVIPINVVDRPKGYFPVPALKYLEGSYLEMVRDTLESRQAKERGLFQNAYVDQLLDAPMDHITPLRGSKLWQIALLEMWFQIHGV